MSTCRCVSALVAIATVLACSAAIGQSVALDHVDGLYAGDTVYAGQELTFHLRMETDSLVYWGVSNGFRIFGTGGGPDIEDLIYLNNYVNSGGPAPPCMDEGDVNNDGSVNRADVDYLQAYMFGGGPAPVACE